MYMVGEVEWRFPLGSLSPTREDDCHPKDEHRGASKSESRIGQVIHSLIAAFAEEDVFSSEILGTRLIYPRD
jgi:hypothetical protein